VADNISEKSLSFIHCSVLTPVEERVIKNFIQCLTTDSSIHAIYLYGSRQKALSHELSDIDIAVIVEKRETVRHIQKKIESWLNDQDFFIFFHPIVFDSLCYSRIGKEITKGHLLWKKE
jgi:predicted nucleotidyltransferase